MRLCRRKLFPDDLGDDVSRRVCRDSADFLFQSLCHIVKTVCISTLAVYHRRAEAVIGGLADESLIFDHRYGRLCTLSADLYGELIAAVFKELCSSLYLFALLHRFRFAVGRIALAV